MDIYEFFYRGPVKAEGRGPAWHVIVSDEVTALGKTQMVTVGPLTPEQCKERFGLDLRGVLAELNSDTLEELGKLSAEHAELQRVYDNFKAEAAQAMEAASAEINRLKNAGLQVARAADVLQTERDAAQAEAKSLRAALEMAGGKLPNAVDAPVTNT